MPPTSVALTRLAVALLVGLLIGLDRERAEVRKAREEFAGVRTFPLIALSGGLSLLLWPVTGPWLLAGSALGVVSIMALSYRRSVEQGHVGATTEMAALATFLLGAMAGAGATVVAGAAGVAVAVLLAAKPRLEAMSRALTQEEIAAVLELAVISVIVLPLLPSQGYGPWRLLNPREIWWVVVLVVGLSFAGFVAVRLLGEQRGLAVTGAVGGLVSSTAVTMAMAERSRDGETMAHPAAAAAVLASSVMAVRVGVLAGVINVGVLPRVLPVLAVMAGAGLAAAWAIGRRAPAGAGAAAGRLSNPFKLTAALGFAAVYGTVLLIARAATEYLGAGGMFAAAAVSSAADVDAVTIAYTRLGAGPDGWRTPAAAIGLALVVNTLVKMGIGVSRGSAVFRGHMARGLGTMAALGALGSLVVYLS